MTFTFVQANTTSAGNSATALTLAYTSNVTTGNLLQVWFSEYNPSVTATVTDTQGNTWTQITSVTWGSQSLTCWYAVAKATGANTVTVTPSSTCFKGLGILEHSFTGGTGVGVDSFLTNTGTSTTTPSCGPITVNLTNELVSVGYAQGNTALASCTAGTGFTLRCNQLNGGSTEGLGVETAENVSTNQTGTFSTSGGVAYGAIGVSFKITGNAATTYTVTPASTTLGTYNTDVFTFRPDGNTTVTVTPTASRGSFSPATGTFDGAGNPFTLTYTAPTTSGADTVSYTNSGTITNPGSTSLTITSATSYTASASKTILAPSQTSTITLTPNAGSSSTVTLTALHGTFTPSNTVIFDGTNASKTVTYNPPNNFTSDTISFSNNGGLTDPSNISITITPLIAPTPTATLAIAGAAIWTCGYATGGVPPYTNYQFQVSPDNVTWTNIGTNNCIRKATDTTFTASTIASTRYCRVQVTDSSAEVNTSASVAVSIPSTTSGNSVQFLASEISHVQALATANDATQWQPFKSSLDSGLNSLTNGISRAEYEGSGITDFYPYALGYIGLYPSNPASAQPYGDKAVAGIINGLLGYHRQGSSCVTYLARGDGTTTVYTIPNSDYVASTLKVMTPSVFTVTLVKGTVNGQDVSSISAGGTMIKISNTSDGTADYIKNTDWQQNIEAYNEYTIDWSLSQNQPNSTPTTLNGGIGTTDTTITVASTSNFLTSGTIQINNEQITYAGKTTTTFTGCVRAVNGTTAASHSGGATVSTVYYLTYVDTFSSSGNVQTLNTNYTLAGTSITFTAAPTSSKAVCLEYMHGTHATDYSTLAYQQTYGNLGGVATCSVDGPGYPTRYLQYVAMMIDWVWIYPGFSWSLKAQMVDYIVNMGDWIESNGYHVNDASSNYGQGHAAFLTAIAIMLQNRDTVNAARYKTRIQNYYTNNFLPTIANPSGSVGTNKDGLWSEGWNYGSFSVVNALMVLIAANEAGFFTDASGQAWANDIMRCLLILQQTKAYIYDGGDGYNYPEPFPSRAVYYMIAHYGTDTTLKAYTNYLIQNYPKSAFDNTLQTNDLYDLCFRDTTATATDWGSNLPTTYHFSGTGLLVTRKDWTYTCPWITFHCGNQTNADHQPLCQGNIEIWRGSDDLLPLVDALTDCFLQNKSKYGATILIDSNATYQTYPSSDSRGPAQDVNNGQYNSVGCYITKWEDKSSYTYATGDYGAAYANTTQMPTTELNRSLLFIRSGNANGDSYLILHDRITVQATGASWLKRFQFPINPSSTSPPCGTNGTSITVTRGTSKLFTQVFGDVPLTGTVNAYSISSKANKIDLTSSNATSANPQVSSATYGFTSSDINNILQITAGTNAILQGYQITAVSGGLATLDRPCGTALSISGVSFSIGGGAKTFEVVQTSNVNTKVRYRTAMQIAPSTVNSADTMTDISSTDTISEGTMIGDVVAIFGVNGAIIGNTSYNYTGTVGHTITHYVSDLQPNYIYSITGGNKSSATTTSKGVLSFTSTASGVAQTISLVPTGVSYIIKALCGLSGLSALLT